MVEGGRWRVFLIRSALRLNPVVEQDLCRAHERTFARVAVATLGSRVRIPLPAGKGTGKKPSPPGDHSDSGINLRSKAREAPIRENGGSACSQRHARRSLAAVGEDSVTLLPRVIRFC